YLAAVPVSAKRIFDALASRPRAEDVASPGPALPLPVAPTAPDATRLTPQRGVNIIGRDPDRAATRNHRIVVNHPMVSRNHAGLLRTDDDQYYIWDLGSAYGTFVDALRIGSSRTLVRPHQTITIGGVRFVFDAHKVMAVAGVATAGIEIRADGIGTEVGPRWNRRLNIAGVRLAVAPRTMLALMGSSGAGKTTLLRTLAAQAP